MRTGSQRERRARNGAPRGLRAGLGLVAVLLVAGSACGRNDLLGPEINADIEEFVALVNAHRASVGCEPLAWRFDVAGVAQHHSDDMVSRAFFAHTNPDGDSPFDRLGEAGVTYSRAAENIAYGYGSAGAVLDGWLGSPGHRRNIENCALREHGIGLTDWHWTHLFVTS